LSVVAFRPGRLSEADIEALRPSILSLIARGRATWWDLDLGADGYAGLVVRGPGRCRLYAITKHGGAYRVVNRAGRRVVESRRLENVLAVLA
jgi:hypothetical protein